MLRDIKPKPSSLVKNLASSSSVLALETDWVNCPTGVIPDLAKIPTIIPINVINKIAPAKIAIIFLFIHIPFDLKLL